MRWLVEVTSLGSSERDSRHVDADTWQTALQAARALRGETAPMSGFSIELLDEGCRAIDQASRLRYEVRRASEDAVPASRPGGSVLPPVFNAARAEVMGTVASQVVFKREQEATASMPLTYREYVYLVPQGTGEPESETLLYAQLELIRTSLERIPPGKLVNLAVFDAPFQGKPTARPVAALVVVAAVMGPAVMGGDAIGARPRSAPCGAGCEGTDRDPRPAGQYRGCH